VLEGLLGADEPEVEFVDPEPVGALPPALELPLEPEPASPESLPLELPVPEPVSPESLPLEELVPDPAKPVSLPLEIPFPAPAKPLPPALELGGLGLEFAKPPPAALEPVLPEDVGLLSLPAVLPGRFEGVLNPLPALELGGVPP
jgi:hypothetical protein